MTAAPNPLPFTPTQGDHPIGCWREPGHHGCAIAVLDALTRDTYYVVDDLLDVHPDAEPATLGDYVDWIAANDIAPDVPQASLPGVA